LPSSNVVDGVEIITICVCPVVDWFVGSFVGDTFGLLAGAKVGLLDGDWVGLFVGDGVGLSVGAGVVFLVGNGVGDGVGLWVGARIGLLDGDWVGLFLGDGVGLTVGAGVGCGVSVLQPVVVSMDEQLDPEHCPPHKTVSESHPFDPQFMVQLLPLDPQ